MLKQVFAAVVLASIVAGAKGQQTGASRHFNELCSVVKSEATTVLQARGFEVTPAKSCSACDVLGLKAKTLKGSNGKRMSGKTILNEYTIDRRTRSSDLGPGWWTSYNVREIDGVLTFEPVPSGCDTKLAYHFGGYGAMFWAFFPVDGDPTGYQSNGRLESQHLLGIAHKLIAKPEK